HRLDIRQFHTQDFALVDPHLDTDAAKRGQRFSSAVVNIRPKGITGDTSLALPFPARHVGTTQATTALDTDTERALTHGLADRPFNGAAVADTTLELAGDILRHQGGIQVRLIDLGDFDTDFLAAG